MPHLARKIRSMHLKTASVDEETWRNALLSLWRSKWGASSIINVKYGRHRCPT